MKKVVTLMGVIFVTAVVAATFDLDDKLMEKASPYLIALAKKNAEIKKAAAQMSSMN